MAKIRAKKRKPQSSRSTNNTCASSRKVDAGSQRGRKAPRKEGERHFVTRWFEIEAFKQWLIRDPDDPTKPKCKMCNKPMTARLNVLKKHAASKDHLEICRTPINTASDFKMPPRAESMHEREKARAELKLVALCAEINNSFKSISAVLRTFKSICKEDVVKDIRLSKTKARDMLVNVIGKCTKTALDTTLRSTKFSICVDESTDRSKDKALAIIVRFIDFDSKKTKSLLWRMVPVLQKGQKADAGAERLFACIAEAFKESCIPLNNIVGCCFDGCSTMTGEKSGLKHRLENAIPGIVCVQCPAHSTHLCTQYAVQELPSEVISFITMLYNLLNSPHKLHNFKEAQIQKLLEDLGFPQFKILKLCPTRWLVLEQCVNRVIDLWPVIVQFCTNQSKMKDATAKQIVAVLERTELKLYFFVLKKTLHELNSLNTLFQREETVLHVAQEEIEKTFKNIVSCILERDYVISTAAKDIDIFDSTKYLRYIDFDFGEEVRDALLENGDNMETFCRSTLNFIIEMALQMKQRFHNLQHPVYSLTGCLKIENAISQLYRQQNPEKLKKLMALYSKAIDDEKKYRKILSEWDDLPTMHLSKEIVSNKNIIELWIFIMNYENNEGVKPFSEIAKFALVVFTTPHANADPERIFSDQSNCKTKNRNAMDVATVESSLQVRQLIRSQGDFEPTEEMIDMTLNSDFYVYKPQRKGLTKEIML